MNKPTFTLVFLLLMALLIPEAAFGQLVYREPRVVLSEYFSLSKGIRNPSNFCQVMRGIALLNLQARQGDPEVEPNFMVCADLTYRRVVSARYSSSNVVFSTINNVNEPTGLVFDDQRNIWVSDKAPGSVHYLPYNMSNDMLEHRGTFTGFSKPIGLAFIRNAAQDARLYVADSDPGTITELDAITGAVLQSRNLPEVAFADDMTTGWNPYRPSTPKFLYVLTHFFVHKIDPVTLTINLSKNLREDPAIGDDVIPYSIGSGPNGEIVVVDATRQKIHMLDGGDLAHIWSSMSPPGNGVDPYFEAPFRAQPYFNSIAIAQSIGGNLGPEIFFMPARIDQLDILSSLPLHFSSPLDIRFRTTGRGEVELVLHRPSGVTVSQRQFYDAGTHTFQFQASDLNEFGIWRIEAKLRLGDIHSVNPTPTSALSRSFQVIFPLLVHMKDNGLTEPNISKPQISLHNISSSLTLNNFTLRLWLSRQEMPSQEIVADAYYFNPGGVQLSVGSEPDNPNVVFVDLKYPSGYSVPPGQVTATDGAQLGIHFRNYYPGHWARTNDWSWLGITGDFSSTRRVTVYNATGDLLYGEEPPLSSVPQPPQLSAADLFGFEKLFAWGSEQAGLTLSSTRTQGSSSVQVQGGGYLVISALPMKTQDITGETSRLALDLYVPSNQPNPYWVGAAQMYVDCPSAGLNGAFLGHVELTGLPQNQFSTLNFGVPASVLSVLLGSHSDFTFKIILNINAGTAPFLLDNLRFVP